MLVCVASGAPQSCNGMCVLLYYPLAFTDSLYRNSESIFGCPENALRWCVARVARCLWYVSNYILHLVPCLCSSLCTEIPTQYLDARKMLHAGTCRWGCWMLVVCLLEHSTLPWYMLILYIGILRQYLDVRKMLWAARYMWYVPSNNLSYLPLILSTEIPRQYLDSRKGCCTPHQ